MTGRTFRRQYLLYLPAFFLALGLRLAHLGDLPLNDVEARLALDALRIARGEDVTLSSHVAYTHLTALLFFVFGDSDGLARFWPALAGVGLAVGAPLLFRRWLRPRPALILSVLLAIEPGLVALSRQAGSPILALTCLLLAVGFWLHRRQTWSGIFLALALLSGPSLWHGLLGLTLAGLLFQFTALRPPAPAQTAEAKPPAPSPAHSPLRLADFTPLILPTLAALFSLSTLMLMVPQGWGAWANSLPDYLRGWIAEGGAPVGRIGLALGVYPLLGLLFAGIAIVRGLLWGSRRTLFLALWALAAMLVTLFYPSRQVADLAWALLPLWTLAACQLAHDLRLPSEGRWEAVGVATLTVVLSALAWLNFNALYWTPFPSEQATLRLILSIGVLLFLVALLVLISLGWSKRVVQAGAIAGSSLMLGLYTLGAAWGAAGLRDPGAVELWHLAPPVAQARLVAQTADQISEWTTGHAHRLPMVVYGVDSPALLWALRRHRPSAVSVLLPTSAPEMVLTPLQRELGLAAAYRGQDFAWRQSPIWEVFPSHVFRWLTYRHLPVTSEVIILWVRSDLMVDVQPSRP